MAFTIDYLLASGRWSAHAANSECQCRNLLFSSPFSACFYLLGMYEVEYTLFRVIYHPLGSNVVGGLSSAPDILFAGVAYWPTKVVGIVLLSLVNQFADVLDFFFTLFRCHWRARGGLLGRDERAFLCCGSDLFCDCFWGLLVADFVWMAGWWVGNVEPVQNRWYLAFLFFSYSRWECINVWMGASVCMSVFLFLDALLINLPVLAIVRISCNIAYHIFFLFKARNQVSDRTWHGLSSDQQLTFSAGGRVFLPSIWYLSFFTSRFSLLSRFLRFVICWRAVLKEGNGSLVSTAQYDGCPLSSSC